MPPQVHKAGAEAGPVVQQSPAGVEQVKSSEPEKKPTEQQTETSKNDAPKPYRATSKEASNRKAELSTQAAAQQAALNGKLERKAAKSEKAAKPATSKEDAKLIELAKKANADVMKGMSDAKAIDLLHKANAHVMDGMGKAQEITKHYREATLQKKGEELATELKQLASGKPSFEESERMIQKIDAYNSELSKPAMIIFCRLLAFSIRKP